MVFDVLSGFILSTVFVSVRAVKSLNLETVLEETERSIAEATDASHIVVRRPVSGCES